MLNDILAVCVAGMVVVVIATILGGVELLQRLLRHGSDNRTSRRDTPHPRQGASGAGQSGLLPFPQLRGGGWPS
jgi:hypothetical protein